MKLCIPAIHCRSCIWLLENLSRFHPGVIHSSYLFADKVRAVAQTLNGSKVEMIVNGKKYIQEMTPQVETKEDAVVVINYVLNNFGNKAGYVTLADVQHVEVKKRSAQ